jgi:hypothetical protein
MPDTIVTHWNAAGKATQWIAPGHISVQAPSDAGMSLLILFLPKNDPCGNIEPLPQHYTGLWWCSGFHDFLFALTNLWNWG